MTTESAAKKDTQKLQRAVVDALEDVKAQDIVVFDTEHLSALFERVIVASGSSNRQTKALAASVRDKVRDAGFRKPRIEGEANGEWIIVDCLQVVVHIMQPSFRQYYHLEELWGEKPVRIRLGAAKPALPAAVPKPVPKVPTNIRRSSAARLAVREAEAQDKPRHKPARTSSGGSIARPAPKAPARTRAGTAAKAPAAAPARAAAAPAKPAPKAGAGKPLTRPAAKVAAKSPVKTPAKSAVRSPARSPANAPAKSPARSPARSAADGPKRNSGATRP